MCEVNAKISRGGSDQLGSQIATRNRVFSHGLIQKADLCPDVIGGGPGVADDVRCVG
jgi:hypothetical protein